MAESTPPGIPYGAIDGPYVFTGTSTGSDEAVVIALARNDAYQQAYSAWPGSDPNSITFFGESYTTKAVDSTYGLPGSGTVNNNRNDPTTTRLANTTLFYTVTYNVSAQKMAEPNPTPVPPVTEPAPVPPSPSPAPAPGTDVSVPPAPAPSVDQNTAGRVDQARVPAITKDASTDWRFRISLANDANYLYNVANDGDILYPLKLTQGVVFPYVPQIQLNYTANYEPVEITHSNYKIFNYRSSAVEAVGINADFTAQDTTEANYLAAVIHFFKCVTKMFYGKDDTNVKVGTPPPLVYLSGHGVYGFDQHPGVVTNFSMTYPNDVDYITAFTNVVPDTGLSTFQKPIIGPAPTGLNRLTNIRPKGNPVPPNFPSRKITGSYPTRIPTKMSINLQILPVVTRNDMSNNFSLSEYARGALLPSVDKSNGKRKPTGGIW